jgi:acyl-CoA thioesterase-1
MTFANLFRILPFFLITIAWAPAMAQPVAIVGFGDSLMAGYQLGPGEAFTDRLQAALQARGHAATVANAGVSGDTSSDGLARLDWSVPDGTDLVILELGANDMLRGIDPAIIEKNLDAMIGRLKARGIAVLLAGMRAAPNLGAAYQQAFDGIYPRLAERHGLVLVPFFLDGVAGERSLQLSDAMHPNAEGAGRMAAAALPYVEKALAALPAKAGAQ